MMAALSAPHHLFGTNPTLVTEDINSEMLSGFAPQSVREDLDFDAFC